MKSFAQFDQNGKITAIRMGTVGLPGEQEVTPDIVPGMIRKGDTFDPPTKPGKPDAAVTLVEIRRLLEAIEAKLDALK